MSERSNVLALLDEVHAAECAGARAMEQWRDTCRSPELRGALRIIAARNQSHATLAAERLRALGATPSDAASAAPAQLLALVASPDVPDEAKLAALASRCQAEERGPICEAAARIVEDGETRALIETMGDDDQVSFAWLRRFAGGVRETTPKATPLGPALARSLEALRAAEAASAAVFEAWSEACEHPGLRGGLRTIAAREATHAAVLATRVGEVSDGRGASEASLPVSEVIARWGSVSWPDEAKLDALLGRYPDGEAVARPVEPITTAADVETRALLRLLVAGDQASMAWLRAYRGPGTCFGGVG